MIFSITIPTYNERDNIEKLVTKIFDSYPAVLIKVVDDNSPDGTAQVVRELMRKYPNLSLLSRQGKEGLGKAYIHCFKEIMRESGATHIITMDADMSHDPVYLKEMIAQTPQYDLVIGSRYVLDGETVGWEVWRKALSYYGNLYARFITRAPIKDLTGGFNCINISTLRKVNLDRIDSSGYAFQIELKYALCSVGATVKEVPIVFKNRTGGESKISNHIIKEGILAPWKMIFRK